MEIEVKLFGMDSLGSRNCNGRVYTEDVLKNAIDRWEHSDKTCQVGFKNVTKSEDGPNIALKDTAGKVNDIFIKDKSAFAKIELLDTPQGKIAKELIESGYDMKFTLSGTGDCDTIIDENGKESVIVRNFNINSVGIF